MSARRSIDDLRYRIVKRFIRLAEPDDFPVVMHRKRIFILPTGFGFFFSMLLFAMLMGALNYANSMGLILTFLISGGALLAMISVYRNIASLRLTSIHASPVFAGEIAAFQISIRDTLGRDRPAIQAKLRDRVVWCDVPAYETRELTLDVLAKRRGWQQLSRFKVCTEYPLALFNAWSWINPYQRCLVYPTPETRPPPLPMDGEPADGGRHEHGDEDLAGIREYRRGDAGRLIAWKATARSGQLMSKELESRRGEQVWLAWHQTSQSDTERMLSRLTAWVLDADRSGVAYGLELPGHKIPVGNGPDHLHQCLKTLALFDGRAPK
ncbi:MAG: membrane protein [Lysobacteraceae bacterium]|nr:MAG: membrane protein [Xanthomonadaceae bacterium]